MLMRRRRVRVGSRVFISLFGLDGHAARAMIRYDLIAGEKRDVYYDFSFSKVSSSNATNRLYWVSFL